MNRSTAHRLAGVGPEDYFSLDWGREGTRREELIVFEETQGGAFEYGWCNAQCGGWHCNWEPGHLGPHDAWLEGEGKHVARWQNENDMYTIREEAW